MTTLFNLCLLVSAVSASLGLHERADDTAVVHLGTSRGIPKHLASGFEYGIPDTSGQIPSKYWTGLDVNSCRCGGAQLDAPSRGWIYGLLEYYGRFNSTLSNYEECRQYGAEFSWLPHDIWGTDHSDDDTVWPGDNGNWSSYDQFLTQLMNDIYNNNAIEGSVWDIWNEPDVSVFWKRSQQQWIDLFIRTFKTIRSDSRFEGMKIAGPSLNHAPEASRTWWTSWLAQISGNSTIPDQYSYHILGHKEQAVNDPTYTNASLSAMLEEYGLPSRQVSVNEYGRFDEALPSGYAWWISALERFDMIGLLGNGNSNLTLHDLMADLITKESDPYDYVATDYAPASGYWVYHYYATNMTGTRVAVDRSGDGVLDVYATVGSDRVRLLVGTRTNVGTWYVTLDDLEAAGLPSSGSIKIDTWGFDGVDYYIPSAAPSFRNRITHHYTDNTLTFAIYQTDDHTAWAFEFDVV